MGNLPFAPLLFLLPRVYFVSNLEANQGQTELEIA